MKTGANEIWTEVPINKNRCSWVMNRGSSEWKQVHMRYEPRFQWIKTGAHELYMIQFLGLNVHKSDNQFEIEALSSSIQINIPESITKRSMNMFQVTALNPTFFYGLNFTTFS